MKLTKKNEKNSRIWIKCFSMLWPFSKKTSMDLIHISLGAAANFFFFFLNFVQFWDRLSYHIVVGVLIRQVFGAFFVVLS